MTLTEYQQRAHATAIYRPEDAVEYLSLGLLSEVGEVCGVIAKAILGRTIVDRTKLTRELGDVMWACAEIATLSAFELRISRYSNLPILECCQLMARDAVRAVAFLKIEQTIRLEFEVISVVGWLMTIANKYNISIEDILQTNLTKLADRAERGVIAGSGDER